MDAELLRAVQLRSTSTVVRQLDGRIVVERKTADGQPTSTAAFKLAEDSPLTESSSSAVALLVADEPQLTAAARLFGIGVTSSAAIARARQSGASAAAVERFAHIVRQSTADAEKSDSPDFASPVHAHGLVAGCGKWRLPERVTDHAAPARPGYTSKDAHEFRDHDDVLDAKVAALAEMLRVSRACVAYTGAGISTAAGIRDLASPTGGLGTAARGEGPPRPTVAHHALCELAARQLGVHEWVEQNHDGLARAAGFPADQLNEIHGAMGDSANPIVPMGGALQPARLERLHAWAARADLVLALGSSLCGMHADVLVAEAAGRRAHAVDGALGAVIVSLQRTPHDVTASLRIYAPLDDVMRRLCAALGCADALQGRVAGGGPRGGARAATRNARGGPLARALAAHSAVAATSSAVENEEGEWEEA